MSPARFWLGMAQMAAATIAFVFLVMTGVSLLTISAALVSTTLTILSRGLHGSSTKSQSHSLLTGLGMAAAGVMERVRRRTRGTA